MNDKNFKEQVKHIATAPSLQKKQLHSLQQLLAPPKPKREWFFNTWFGGFYSGALASLFLVVIMYTYYSTPDLAQRIANEIVTNHIQLKPMDVESSNFNTVKRYFSLLDFSPVDSSTFTLDKKVLIGGRYCSIEGVLSAQLRYQDTNGNLYTLYQTNYEENLFSKIRNLRKEDAIISRYAKGLVVNIWLEHGLLMASVSEEQKAS